MQPMIFPRGDLLPMPDLPGTGLIKLWLEKEREEETIEIERQKKKQKEHERMLAEQRRKAGDQEQQPAQNGPH